MNGISILGNTLGNHINGKDRPVPLKCAKCKHLNWNNPAEDEIIGDERGLRARLANLELDVTFHQKGRSIRSPNDFCKKFLQIKPRPTRLELLQAIEEPEQKKRHQFMEQVIKSRDPEFEYIHGKCCTT